MVLPQTRLPPRAPRPPPPHSARGATHCPRPQIPHSRSHPPPPCRRSHVLRTPRRPARRLGSLLHPKPWPPCRRPDVPRLRRQPPALPRRLCPATLEDPPYPPSKSCCIPPTEPDQPRRNFLSQLRHARRPHPRPSRMDARRKESLLEILR